MFVTKQPQSPLTPIVFFDHEMGVNGNQKCLLTSILQSIFFRVSHTSLDQHEDE